MRNKKISPTSVVIQILYVVINLLVTNLLIISADTDQSAGVDDTCSFFFYFNEAQMTNQSEHVASLSASSPRQQPSVVGMFVFWLNGVIG